MGDWKEELQALVGRDKQRQQEVEEVAEQNTLHLRKAREEVTTFIKTEVLPALKEIAAELQPHFKSVSVESVDSGAALTMASGVKMEGESKYTHEIQYRVEVQGFAKKAKGRLLMLYVVPPVTGERDYPIGQLEIRGSGNGGNVFGITREDIRSNFLHLYRRYVN